MEGTVKWYNVKKGYGFIAGKDDKEYFVHFTGLTQGTKLYTDDVVEFEAVETEKGLQAQKVSKSENSETEAAPKEAPAKEIADETPKVEAEEVKEKVEEKKAEEETEKSPASEEVVEEQTEESSKPDVSEETPEEP